MRQVAREAVGIVETPDEVALDGFKTSGLGVGKVLFELSFAAVEGITEGLFFLVEDTLEIISFGSDRRKDVTLQNLEEVGIGRIPFGL
jgi:hypothetical protein